MESPLVKFGSTVDRTNTDLGVRCSRLSEPLPDMGVRGWSSWAKIAQILEGSL